MPTPAMGGNGALGDTLSTCTRYLYRSGLSLMIQCEIERFLLNLDEIESRSDLM